MGLLTRHTMRRLVPRLALLGLAWLAVTGHMFSGCKGLFEPAVPEPPSGPPIKVDYSSPEATLKTMERGMQAKGYGSSAWLGAFNTAYNQVFDPADLVACKCEAPTSWGVSEEQAFYLEFLNVRPSDDYAAVFDSVADRPDPPAEEQLAVLHRYYRVYANAIDGNGTTIIALGFADLTFTKTGASWLITRWVDGVDPDASPVEPDQLTLGRRRLESTR